MVPPPPLRLQAFDLSAGIKRKPPSAAVLTDLGDDGVERAVLQARTYARAGAAAVSVLTEPERFAGSMAQLRAVASALAPLGVPVMRKDFLVSPLQVAEARLAGAGGVLLIVRMLEPEVLRAMRDLALELGMLVLLESFDGPELDAASALLGPAPVPGQLLRLNTRDLRTLEVDPTRLARLAGVFPERVFRVAESGLSLPGDAARVASQRYRLASQRYRLALVGSALMRAPDPATLLAEMISAERAACG